MHIVFSYMVNLINNPPINLRLSKGPLPQTFSSNNFVSNPKTKNPNIAVEVCGVGRPIDGHCKTS